MLLINLSKTQGGPRPYHPAGQDAGTHDRARGRGAGAPRAPEAWHHPGAGQCGHAAGQEAHLRGQWGRWGWGVGSLSAGGVSWCRRKKSLIHPAGREGHLVGFLSLPLIFYFFFFFRHIVRLGYPETSLFPPPLPGVHGCVYSYIVRILFYFYFSFRFNLFNLGLICVICR